MGVNKLRNQMPMRPFYLIYLLIMLLIPGLYTCRYEKNQSEGEPLSISRSDASMYDSIRASEYGADEYGMKKYVMAFLKKGPNRDLDSAEAVSLQIAHLKNIQKMAEQGKLVLAGPFFGDGEIRGIYIFNVETLTEAEELTRTDPAIQAGSLVMDLKEWYGSAALQAVNDIHKTLSKKDISDR
jgi:uncharacterized protein YciI